MDWVHIGGPWTPGPYFVLCPTSQIINTCIKFLAQELKPIIFWPSKESIQDHLPASQKHYPHLRCTLDCSEIYIGRPRDLEIQALTWSEYKRHNTVKFLVGIPPNGMISFILKAWGGRTLPGSLAFLN